MKILGWAVSAIIILVIIFLGIIYLLPSFDLYSVQSDSMHRVFKAGDAIVTVPQGFLGKNISVGSIVTFNSGGKVITHRILSIDAQGNITTKGDANEDPDAATISIFAVHGIYLFKIPYLGYVDAFVHTRIGWFVSIIVPAILLVVWLVIEILREAFKRKEGMYY